MIWFTRSTQQNHETIGKLLNLGCYVDNTWYKKTYFDTQDDIYIKEKNNLQVFSSFIGLQSNRSIPCIDLTIMHSHSLVGILPLWLLKKYKFFLISSINSAEIWINSVKYYQKANKNFFNLYEVLQKLSHNSIKSLYSSKLYKSSYDIEIHVIGKSVSNFLSLSLDSLEYKPKFCSKLDRQKSFFWQSKCSESVIKSLVIKNYQTIEHFHEEYLLYNKKYDQKKDNGYTNNSKFKTNNKDYNTYNINNNHKNILYISGYNVANPLLAHKLQNHGIIIDRLIAYNMIEAKIQMNSCIVSEISEYLGKDKRLFILSYSYQNAIYILNLINLYKFDTTKIVLVCISDRVTSCFIKSGINFSQIITAVKPDENSMLKILLANL